MRERRRMKPSKPDLTDIGPVECFVDNLQSIWYDQVGRRFRNVPSTLKTIAVMLVVGSIVNRTFQVRCVEIGTHAREQCAISTAEDGVTADMLGDFVIATACSHGYFYQLENLIGSIHYWEPHQKIIVYDIGMSHEQLSLLNCYVNVSVIPFPFHSQPEHIANLYNYAWKIVIIDDALKRHDSVLMLDSGLELRAPLWDVRRTIADTGHFSVVQPGSVARFTHPDTFAYLGVNVSDPRHEARWNVPFYAGGIQGFRTDSIAYNTVLPAALQCAKDEQCIHPDGAGRNNHNYDQSVLSVLLRENGFLYYSNVQEEISPGVFANNNGAERYASFQSFRWTLDETRCDDSHVLALRKHQWNKVYRRHLRKRAFCSRHPPIVAATAEEDEVVESSLNQRLSGNSSLLTCLRKNHNNRVACSAFLHEGTQEWLQHSYLLQKTGYATLNALRALVFCPITCLLCAAMAGLACALLLVSQRTFLEQFWYQSSFPYR